MHCETLNNPKPADALSAAARERLLSVRGEPLFVADWLRAVFIHYEVPAAELRSCVPFQLDLFGGKAFISLVAFTMQGMRPHLGGRLAAWLLKPISTNDYLNVRTFVRHRNEAGIYFLTEWMNNRWSVRLGPFAFGLPYRFGDLNYQYRHETGTVCGDVRETPGGPCLSYRADLSGSAFAPCAAGSLDEFLLERYTAFTAHNTKRRFFRIWHRPWQQTKIGVSVAESNLLQDAWPWFAKARLVGANYSPGVHNVWMGRPHFIAG